MLLALSIVSFFLGLVTFFVLYAKKETRFGMKRDLGAISHSLHFLDSIGKDGEWYLFRDLKAERFLQFRRVSSGNTHDIQLAYPVISRNAPYIEGVKRILSKHGVKYWARVEKADNKDFPFRPEPGRDECGFIYASFGSDFKKATEVAREIFLDLYGIDKSDMIWVKRRRNKP